MNSHEEIQRRLSAYSGGDLDPAERTRIEAHLASCQACRAELADMNSTLRLIRTTPGVEPPYWMTSRIMAHLREEQVAKRSWLQRIRFPQSAAFPVKALVLLVVCVSGYYLSRTVETDLQLSSRQQLQDSHPQQAPSPPPSPAKPPDSLGKQSQPTGEQLRKPVPPAAPPEPGLRQETPVRQAPPPALDIPAAPAHKDQFRGPSESLKSAPAAESLNRVQDAAPEKKMKKEVRIENGGEIAPSPVPAAAGRAAGAPEGLILPPVVLRLNVPDPSTAANLIRGEVLRSGGSITGYPGKTVRRITARIPADQQKDLLEHLQQIGSILVRPAAPPTGAQFVELDIQW